MVRGWMIVVVGLSSAGQGGLSAFMALQRPAIVGGVQHRCWTFNTALVGDKIGRSFVASDLY